MRAAHASTAQHSLTMSCSLSSSSLLATALARLDAGCLGCVGTLRFALASRLAASACKAEQICSNKPYAHCPMHFADYGMIVYRRLTGCSKCNFETCPSNPQQSKLKRLKPRVP